MTILSPPGAPPGGWSVDTLGTFLQKQIDDMRMMLQERYATQTKAVDAAFDAQQRAMQVALAAAETAVQAAMISAEKAVTKAEIASDKRFDGAAEAVEAMIVEIRKALDANTERVNVMLGSSAATERNTDAGDRMSIAWIAAALVITGIVVNVVITLLQRH